MPDTAVRAAVKLIEEELKIERRALEASERQLAVAESERDSGKREVYGLEIAVKLLRKRIPTENVSRSTARQSGAGDDGQDVSAAPDVKDPTGKRNSMAGAIWDAVNSLKETEFRTSDVRRQLLAKDAEMVARFPRNYLSTRLWYLASRGSLEITKHAENGGSNTYVLTKKNATEC